MLDLRPLQKLSRFMMGYVLGRQLASLYGPLGPALVKFPTIFPTQLSGECFLVEGDGVGCTQLPLVGGQLPCLLFLKDTPPPSKFWLSRPHPGGTPPIRLIEPSAPYTVDCSQTRIQFLHRHHERSKKTMSCPFDAMGN